ncbi:MAG: hypothetical protein ACRD68_16935, partial [Pyrinomonadaceae bacterium]
ILKGAGARLRIDYAPELIGTRMQTNFREIWEGFTKNLFAGAKFSLPFALAVAAGVFLSHVVPPLLALLSVLMLAAGGGEWWAPLLLPTALVWLIQVATFAAVNRNWGVPVRYALAAPLGQALFIAILLNSALRVAAGSGVTWKGRKLYERSGVRPPRGGGVARTPDLPVTDE